MRLFLILMCLLFSNVSTAGGPTLPPVAAEISGPITDKSVGPLTQALKLLSIMTVKPEAVVLTINSPGGEYDAGFELSKAIENSPVPVVCIVDGDAASMAFFVLQSCDIRISTARSSFMIHETSLVGSFKRRDIPSLLKSMEVKNNALVQHCTKRAKMTPEAFAAKIAEGDWWMTPKEALTAGFIDEIRP